MLVVWCLSMRWARTPRSMLCMGGPRKERGLSARWLAIGGKNTTLLSSMSMEGVGPSLDVEGATNREVFETYVELILAPTLRRGQVVVMDNLTAHKGERVRELIEGQGCELMYLPPYSPDFNPIEEAFSKIKGLMRKAEARSREALLEAMGRAISALSAEDARGFFEHCGYRAMVQAF